FQRKARQQPVHPPVRREQVVVEAGVDPGLEVVPAPGRVDVRRPGDRQRVHPVDVFQLVGGEEAVLAAGTGHDTVVAAVVAAVTVAERAELGLALRPVDLRLAFGNAAGGAHAFLVEGDGRLLRVAGVPVVAGGARPAVAVGAAGGGGDLR